VPGVVEQLLQLGGVVEKAAVAGVGDGQLVTRCVVLRAGDAPVSADLLDDESGEVASSVVRRCSTSVVVIVSTLSPPAASMTVPVRTGRSST